MKNANVCGTVELTTGSELERCRKLQPLPEPLHVTMYFKGRYTYTRGRIMTADPADAYPDEHDLEVQLTMVEVCCEGDQCYEITDEFELGDIEDEFFKELYDADLEPLHEPYDPREDI